jgi:CHAD domain-containing protein
MTEAVRRNPASESVIQIGYTAYPVLTPTSTVGEGLRIMVSSGVRSLRIASQRDSADRPDTIHRFRVSLRRLRSVLGTFASVLPDDERRLLNQRLGSIGRAYAAVREWDVFLSGTLRPMSEALPEEPAVLEVEAMAREARRQALPSPDSLRRQADDAIATIEQAPWLQRPSLMNEAEWQKNLRIFTSDLLARRHRKLRKRLKTVDIANQIDFHDLRVQAKKMRYPIEMASNIFDGLGVDDYLGRLIAVQDALGHLNDAVVARDRVAELALSSRSQGVVSGWLAHETRFRQERFPSAAKRLRKAAPFWE